MKSKYDFYVLTAEGRYKGSKERFPILTFVYPLKYTEAREVCKRVNSGDYDYWFEMMGFLAHPENKSDREVVVTMKPKGVKLGETNLANIKDLCIQR